jgi:ABC-type Fe3+/spermidine/putrescine transport system ATPase subunit
MLKVESLRAATGGFRLRDIDLKVGEGSCHAVLGPSGSGKSTLLNAILGLLPLQKGCILLRGVDITHQPIERRGLGYLPQRIGLFPHLTVLGNITYSARARGVPAEKYQPLLDKLVEATGIGELLSRFPDTLSGGERQRVALVRALASQPRLVLLDEPFTALNESLRRELWWLMRDLQSHYGLTVLLVTHNLEEAYFLADTISILIDGEIKQSGHKSEVYSHPATSAVARFLGINNLWDGTIIGQDDGALTVACPTIGVTARFPGTMNPPAAFSPVTVGILAEHVSLRDAAHPSKPSEHVLTGQIRLLDCNGRWLIQFHHDSSPLVLDLYAAQRTVDAFGLTDGQTGITIGLPPSALFWMPREE